jgi:hypothetical protein
MLKSAVSKKKKENTPKTIKQIMHMLTEYLSGV